MQTWFTIDMSLHNNYFTFAIASSLTKGLTTLAFQTKQKTEKYLCNICLFFYWCVQYLCWSFHAQISQAVTADRRSHFFQPTARPIIIHRVHTQFTFFWFLSKWKSSHRAVKSQQIYEDFPACISRLKCWQFPAMNLPWPYSRRLIE